MACNVFLWIWDYNFAFTAGFDSSSRAFALHYRTLFWAELLIVGAFAGLWYGWLVRTGRSLLGEPIAPAEETRRVVVLWGIIGVTSLSIYLEASFWPNWDGAWHQTMVRDTALTPTHIPMFYFFFPMSVVLALGAYLYGRFRIPAVYGGERVSLVLLPADRGSGARIRGGCLNNGGIVSGCRRNFSSYPSLAVRYLRMAGGRSSRSWARPSCISSR